VGCLDRAAERGARSRATYVRRLAIIASTKDYQDAQGICRVFDHIRTLLCCVHQLETLVCRGLTFSGPIQALVLERFAFALAIPSTLRCFVRINDDFEGSKHLAMTGRVWDHFIRGRPELRFVHRPNIIAPDDWHWDVESGF